MNYQQYVEDWLRRYPDRYKDPEDYREDIEKWLT